MKVKNISKKLKKGQAGGIACRKKHGPEFYSKIAKTMHENRRKILELSIVK